MKTEKAGSGVKVAILDTELMQSMNLLLEWESPFRMMEAQFQLGAWFRNCFVLQVKVMILWVWFFQVKYSR